MLKLEHLAARKLRALSNGEWRRVVSAFAFSGAPPLVVLDEPDSGLDPAAVTRLVNLIKLAREQGTTCLVLSHQLPLLEEACDRVGFIDRGELKAMLPIEDVRSRGARHLYRELLEDDYVSEPVEL
jgi:ABC-type multidrug transport system ATPase subunit